ncbi:DUF192 domain-containing protein [Natranaerobius trueperi]|uniref:DUF192 domain-containing protein n=1 Tax=Natranaerobius trueperi TaxID=759412 RepID=A0A226C0Z9_9FIRM|nr:DUF192 domain-containing protein [Natranaerobius trueperi]OWZ84906.1 hypothetical protein CDO51_00430 [Natranaerobius trueperi]
MLIVENKNIILAKHVITFDTFIKRLIGLMGKTHLSSYEALVIDQCSQVHTMFVFFKLDLIFIDNDNRIIEIVNELKPFSLSPKVKNASKVIELTGGKLSQFDIQKGDRLNVIR